MTKHEHKMLAEIHDHIKNAPTRAQISEATRTVVRRITSFIGSDEKPAAPSNEARKKQVQEVRKILDKAYREERKLTLHAACLEVWTPLLDGYPTPKSLYEYCHEHESEL